MIQIARTVLSGCLIFYLVSCASCKKWNWKADPYEASSQHQDIMNQDGTVCACNDDCFDDFTCFTSENIAELRAAIETLNISNKKKSVLLKQFDMIFR